jgi:hypothetical protein
LNFQYFLAKLSNRTEERLPSRQPQAENKLPPG